MKFSALILSLVLPVSAFAVRVNDCPETLQVNLDSLSALSTNQVIQASDSRLDESDAKSVGQIRDGIYGLRKFQSKLKLVEKSSAYCQYLPAGETKLLGDNETRLVRKSGRDLLRVAIDLKIPAVVQIPGIVPKGNEYVWIYLNLESYSPKGVVITPVRGAKVLGWFDHGSPIHHFGWANDISAN